MSGIQRFLASRQISRIQDETTFVATGGSITQTGGYKIHTFSSTGSSIFEITYGQKNIELLVVAGGGGGGYDVGGGGGGGGLCYSDLYNVVKGTYSVIVGAGGAGATAGGVQVASGSDSSFGGVQAIGGGGGGN